MCPLSYSEHKTLDILPTNYIGKHLTTLCLTSPKGSDMGLLKDDSILVTIERWITLIVSLK